MCGIFGILFKKLKGMFAFAFYDKIEKKLLIVRDRFGIKPLYVFNDDNTLFEKSHPLLRDKWIVRKLADRYIPKKLSRRKKLGFPTTALERMNISFQ